MHCKCILYGHISNVYYIGMYGRVRVYIGICGRVRVYMQEQEYVI